MDSRHRQKCNFGKKSTRTVVPAASHEKVSDRSVCRSRWNGWVGATPAFAQYVSVKSNYVPTTCTPSGWYSIPAGTYRVMAEYGTINNGDFKATIGPQYTAAFPFTNGGQGNWGVGGTNVAGQPTPLFIRATLQKEGFFGTWSDTTKTAVTLAY